jgi:coenzyme PQQ precursor peptide PqqA
VQIHDFLEAAIMTAGLSRRACRGDDRPRDVRIPAAGRPAAAPPDRRPPTMQWQTPTATDFRFGFEITMYVAAR